MTRLPDVLPNVDEITALFSPQEVPAPLMGVISTSVMLRNTRSWSTARRPRTRRMPASSSRWRRPARRAEALGQRPSLTLAVSPVSPLIFTEKVTAAIMVIAEAGLPLFPAAPSLAPQARSRWRAARPAACRGAGEFRHRGRVRPGHR